MDLELRIQQLERKLARVTAARVQAEQLLEQKSQELYQALQSTERARVALEAAAYTDELTGLGNRRQLYEQYERLSDGQVGFVALDLDGFKPINDHFGHDAGDEVLRVTAKRIRSQARGEDCVARLGGDEFGLLCVGVDSEQTLVRIGDRIRASLMEPIVIDGRKHLVSASVGIALGRASDNLDSLLVQADRAMYESKRSGKNRVTLSMMG